MADKPANEQAIFEVARKIDSLEARQAYLQQICGQDLALEQRVKALLRAYQEGESFLESPPPELGSAPTMDQPITEKPGSRIGSYKLLQQIGEGGFGVVYMAEQTEPVQRPRGNQDHQTRYGHQASDRAIRGRTPGAGHDGSSEYCQSPGRRDH